MKQALIVRNGIPGRFTPVAKCLQDNGWAGAVINGPVGTDIEDWTNIRWSTTAPNAPSSFAPANRFEKAVRQGGAAANAAQQLKADGFTPDIIIGHPGWGEMLFLAEIFPDVPQIQLGEYYYHSEGADANFDPEFPAQKLASRVNITSQNAVLAMSYTQATAIVTPHHFRQACYLKILSVKFISFTKVSTPERRIAVLVLP